MIYVVFNSNIRLIFNKDFLFNLLFKTYWLKLKQIRHYIQILSLNLEVKTNLICKPITKYYFQNSTSLPENTTKTKS